MCLLLWLLLSLLLLCLLQLVSTIILVLLMSRYVLWRSSTSIWRNHNCSYKNQLATNFFWQLALQLLVFSAFLCQWLVCTFFPDLPAPMIVAAGKYCSLRCHCRQFNQAQCALTLIININYFWLTRHLKFSFDTGFWIAVIPAAKIHPLKALELNPSLYKRTL